jgi:hypothetical protein
MNNNITILKEIFPEHYNRIYNQLDDNAELQSIIDDLFECHSAINDDDFPGTNSLLLPKYYSELLEELKKEILLHFTKTH